MGLPGQRRAKSYRKHRAQHMKLSAVALQRCATCGAPRRPHRACASCGTYKRIKK